MQGNHIVSRARCGLAKKQSASCPGEKAMAKKINWASAEHNKQDSSIAAGAQKMLNQEQWSEDFQDLSGYCNIGSIMVDSLALHSGEQLNTPNITVQDGFDFGLRSSSGERFEALEDPDPWEALRTAQSSPQISTSHTKLWDSVTDWLSASPNPDIDHDPQFDIIHEEKPRLLMPESDYLLSQSPPEYSGSCGGESGGGICISRVPTPGQDYKEKSVDLVSLLDQTENNSINNSNSSLQHAPFILSTANNNNIRVTNNIVDKSMESKNCSNNSIKSFPIKTSQPTYLLPNQQNVKTEEFYSYNINKNRRDSTNNNHELLSSIFKTEEPIIGERVKQQYSSLRSETEDDLMRIGEEIKRSSPAVIIVQKEIPDEVLLRTTTANCQRMQNVDQRSATVEYIIPDNIVKAEPLDCEEMEVVTDTVKKPINNTSGGGIVKQKQMFKVPSQMKKPGLKLDIDSATCLMASTNALQGSIAGDSLDTPDVLKPLLGSGGGFDLISYCEESEESGNLFNDGRDSPVVVDVKKNLAVIKPISRPPLKRPYEKVMQDKFMGKKEFEEDGDNEDAVSIILPTIKEEEEDVAGDEEPSCSSTSPAAKRRRRTSTRKTAGKRRRLVMISDDLESEGSLVSDYNDNEDNDETFQPPSSSKQISNGTKRQRTNSRSLYPAVNTTSSRRRISSSEVDSDQDSIASSVDRYRELRDRNNEASRRSRMNRKSREMEMKGLASKLEEENKALKKKADNMERLVKKLREGLMQLVLQNRR